MPINKKSIVYIIFTISLFIGFLFEENSSGGARYDHNYFSDTIKNFSLGLQLGFEQFVKVMVAQLMEVLFIHLGFISYKFLKLFDSIYLFKFYFVLCSSLPIFFI